MMVANREDWSNGMGCIESQQGGIPLRVKDSAQCPGVYMAIVRQLAQSLRALSAPYLDRVGTLPDDDGATSPR